MKKQEILIVGSANMDMVVTVNRFPNPGETILSEKFGMFPGGKGANQAVACARLGSKTHFIGKMGNDFFRDKLIQSMTTNQVNMEYTLIDEKESTGVALIYVDADGQNEIVVVSGSNMKITPDEIESNAGLFKQVNVVLTQLEIPLESVISAAKLTKKNDGDFILNPAPACEIPDELFTMVDYLTPNESELALLSGRPVTDISSAIKAAKIILKQGAKNIVVTLGEKGSLLVNNDRSELFPTDKVEAKDATAAGDAFNGALAFGLSNNLDLDTIIRTANCVATYSVTKRGAQSSLPSIEDIEPLIDINLQKEN
ncbi:MAG: ribokinase [Candidatus Marinimicrobia bacterium]|nr:ribokinase [Candidatus Neomarinimicrobiota bacterium]